MRELALYYLEKSSGEILLVYQLFKLSDSFVSSGEAGCESEQKGEDSDDLISTLHSNTVEI